MKILWFIFALALVCSPALLSSTLMAAPQSFATSKADLAKSIYCPQPPYPIKAMENREEGICRIKVETDKFGKITKVKLFLSSGHEDLDQNTVGFAKSYWHGPPNATWSKEIEYRIRHHFGSR